MNQDATPAICGQIKRAQESGRSLRIVGGDTKHWYGCRRDVESDVLSIADHRGILNYDPTELVITVRAGTPLREIEVTLDQHRQMLAFEPPHCGPASTIGGVIAAGISGPRRPFVGAIRDFVLGVKVANGRGEVLQFGGVVFKNVAGFDAFRLMAGSLGCLAVLLEVSLRVVPKPACERAILIDMDLVTAKKVVHELMQESSSLSAACFDAAGLHLRLSGGESAVEHAMASLGGAADEPEFWTYLRDFHHNFFSSAERLWRICVPTESPELSVAGRWLWDWAGAQRWLISPASTKEVRRVAEASGGHATLFRGMLRDEEVFAPLPRPLFELHRRLKAAFDPAGIFNPGRMYLNL